MLTPLGRWTGHAYTIPPFPTPFSLALHAFLLHGFYAPAIYDINGVFWSLSLEWQFYFTFPLLAWSFHRNGPWFTVAAVAAVNLAYRIVVWRYLLTADTTANWTWCSVFVGRWLEFALGMLAAWQSVRQSATLKIGRRVPAYGLTAIAFALIGSNVAAFSPLSDIPWGLCYYCVLRAALLPRSAPQRLLSGSLLVWIGVISYSIYLLHMPILGMLAPLVPQNAGGHGSILAIAGFGLLIVLPLARIFFRLFEQPFLKRGRAPRPSTELAAASAAS
jgi:peptidoglycan/LPS O-acetylase OafA/YrhL